MVDMGAVSFDPWSSRTGTPDSPDYAVFDLDPMPDVPFAAVRDVARLLHEELARRRVPAALKTSGASGLHVFVPLAAGATFDAARRFCERIAGVVAARHPALATLEREIARRGRRVYLDCLQNLRTKTLASAYSARASAFAGVSTPLRWSDLEDGAEPADFTVRTVPRRLARLGDLWSSLRRGPGVDVSRVA
jgi:bifunctional non-homologous end joining protein LigD